MSVFRKNITLQEKEGKEYEELCKEIGVSFSQRVSVLISKDIKILRRFKDEK